MFKNMISKVAQYAIKQPTMFLLWSTIVGYGISSLGEAGGIYYNKKIDKKERTFMAIQDLLEGVLKLGTFFTLALGLQKYGRGLVESGKIFSTPKNKAMLAEGMATLGLIIGNVLSFNLITPLLRNPIAAYLQKNVFKKKVQDIEPFRIAAQPLNQETRMNPFNQFEAKMQLGTIQRPALTFTSRGRMIV